MVGLKLWEYSRKRVRIVFKDGTVMTGFVNDYVDQEDTDFDYDEIDFVPDGEEMISIGEPEIKSIEIIE